MGGETGSSNFPTTAGGLDRAFNGDFDAFVTALNADASALVYATYLGGAQPEGASDLALDRLGTPSTALYAVALFC